MNPPDFKYDPPGFLIEFAYPEMKTATIEPAPATKNNVEKILMFIAENSSITIAELIDKVGISERTIKRIIKQLQGENRIERTGSKKNGDWIIKKNT